jgi:hypothetical protein
MHGVTRTLAPPARERHDGEDVLGALLFDPLEKIIEERTLNLLSTRSRNYLVTTSHAALLSAKPSQTQTPR